MSIQTQPFSPLYDAGQTVSASTSSANTTFTQGAETLKITNLSGTATNFVYVKVGESSQTASADDLAIAAGETVYVAISRLDDNIAYISAAGTPDLNIIPGYGS